MRFEKIGVATSGTTINNINEKEVLKSKHLNFVTSCEGVKVKWEDANEQDAVNLIVTWEVAIKHDNGLQVWDKAHHQHYRIYNKEVPPTNKDLDKLIEDSYIDFRKYLENENAEPENILKTLTALEIEETRLRLLAACNSEIQS
ncbi:MAG: hypothetical protein ABIN97_04170 [Ginsengibacter sp.]